MGDVLELISKVRGQRDRRQALRLRLNLRARELAQRDQERYFRAMVNDLMYGRLAEDLVPYWEPVSGDIAPRRGKEA